MGGPQTPALGFAMGLERLMLVLQSQQTELPTEPCCDIYFAPMGENAKLKATELCSVLRDEGFCVLTDICGRGLKAQMKYADKIGARFTAVIGDNEIETGNIKLKNMKTGELTDVDLNNITDAVYSMVLSASVEDLTEAITE